MRNRAQTESILNGGGAALAPKSLTAAVFEALRAEILNCRLAPGAKVRIGPLCKRFGVSLSAVREALSRLVAEGLVRVEEQRGFRIAPVSREDLDDLTRVRGEIEGLALRAAIERGDAEWEAGIIAAFHQLSRAFSNADRGSADRVSELHGKFHRALVAACGSPWLLHFRQVLYEQSERYRRLAIAYGEYRRDVDGEHRGLMEAALKRDADTAVARLGAHFSKTARILLEIDVKGARRVFGTNHLRAVRGRTRRAKVAS